MQAQEIAVSSGVSLFHVGPPLALGPLPSFFYFSLSGSDSLTKDPFNQPVQFLQGAKMRVFSMTLPGHEEGLSPHDALQLWARKMEGGLDPLGTFLNEVALAVDFAVKEKCIDPTRMGIGGLSRGALFAAHAAARDPRFRFLLGFAPLTQLSFTKEFAGMQNLPCVKNFDIQNLAPKLSERSTRFYIGNRDTRVGTRACVDVILAFAEDAYAKKIHSPLAECIITPSIGRDGHGTSPEVFRQGSEWIKQCLLPSSS